jgi:hypothetical protein
LIAIKKVNQKYPINLITSSLVSMIEIFLDNFNDTA